MKDCTQISGKLNREPLIRPPDGLLRSGTNCRIGIERESLRCTASGRLSEKAHPVSLGRKDGNPFFTADWAESQIELKTPPCDSTLACHRFLEALTNIALQELAPRHELLWPLSTPCILPAADRIPCARFETASENIRRRNLRKKYPVEMLLLSGIHYNFSFTEDFLRKISDGGEMRVFRENCYLKTARNLYRLLWFAVGLLGASPVSSGKKAAGVSIRNSAGGYRTLCSSRLDLSSAAAYLESIDRCLREGLIGAPGELYAPVRLRFADGTPEINRLELRILDLNPFEKCGISALDMEFLRLLFFHCLLTDEAGLEAFSDNPDAVAEYGFSEAQRLKADELLKRLAETAHRISLEIPDVLETVGERLRLPECSYAERIRKTGELSPEWIRLAEGYRDEALAEAWRLPGFDDLELSTQCMIREALKGGIPFEVVSREDNILRFRKGDCWEYVVQATRTSLDTYVTPLLMNNKIVSKMILREHGLDTPAGIELNLGTDRCLERIQAFAGKRAVVKPVSTNYGIGISVFEEPATERQLREAVLLAGKFDRHVLIEEYCPGREFRFLVIAGRTFAVTHRRACHVVGDGVSTIHELIEKANRHPWRAPGHHRPLVTIQEDEAMKLYLSLQNLDFGSVIPAGQDIRLRRISNISAGGEACDATDRVPDRFKRIAEQAASAFRAVICGVDIILSEPVCPDSAYAVIEANFNPALLIHEFPSEGRPRPAARQILIALGLTGG